MKPQDVTGVHKQVLDMIRCYDKTNPVTCKQISIGVGIKDIVSGKEGGKLRRIVNELRSAGWPICASGDGYYYPKTREEITAYIESLGGRIKKIKEAYDGMVEAALPSWDDNEGVRGHIKTIQI